MHPPVAVGEEAPQPPGRHELLEEEAPGVGQQLLAAEAETPPAQAEPVPVRTDPQEHIEDGRQARADAETPGHPEGSERVGGDPGPATDLVQCPPGRADLARRFDHRLGPLHVGDGGVEHREEGEVGPFQAGEVGEDVVGVGVRLRPVEVEGHEQVEVVQRRGQLAGSRCGGDDVPRSHEQRPDLTAAGSGDLPGQLTDGQGPHELVEAAHP